MRYRLIVDRNINWAIRPRALPRVPQLWPENKPIPEDCEEVVLTGFHTPPAIEEDADGTFKIAEHQLPGVMNDPIPGGALPVLGEIVDVHGITRFSRIIHHRLPTLGGAVRWYGYSELIWQGFMESEPPC